jgi:hypothetical protein
MSLVQGTVSEKNGKLYTHGRLFNVVGLEIGSKKSSDSGSGGTFSDSVADDSTTSSGPVAKPGDIMFTVTVRMYMASTKNAEAVGAATPDDPAASATTANDGGATTATPGATGGASSSTGTGTGTGATTGTGAASGTDRTAAGTTPAGPVTTGGAS